MRESIAAALAALVCGGAAHAVSGPVNGMAAGHAAVGTAPTSPSASSTSTTSTSTTSTSTTGTSTGSATTAGSTSGNTPAGATNGTTLGALPGPPPSSLAPPLGVPPTPAPATPGLPAPSSSTRVLPSSTGLGSQVNNQLRPAGSLSAAQIVDVQAALAAGGLYRGPIDGVFSGATRASVQLFQQIERLPPTGLLDSETLARITTGRSTSTPAGSGGGLGAGVGSNGTTATVGNPATADPFTTLPVGTSGGTVILPTPVTPPFPLSQPLNMSPAMAPPGVLIQP
jgi:peptidoglycan hydrolase-like protein with peptidoglycan-binding domain